MFASIFAWLAKNLLPILLPEIYAILKKEWQKDMEETLAKKKVEQNAQEAVAEVRKPLDPTKSVKEREKDEEDKFDRFRDRLNP